MNKNKCKSCDLNFGTDEEKYNHFVKHHINRFIKYCQRCQKTPFFVSQFSKHTYHKKHVNPLYSYPTLVSGKIFDQICPFCKQAFFLQERVR